MFQRIYNYIRKIKRAKRIKKLKKKVPPYLQKNFEVELNFKLWTTKGARFKASDRLKTINRYSSYSTGILSAYIIILGLLSAFKLNISFTISSDGFAFISTGLSILILVFSQLESANDYKLRAEKHHDCALEIGELYNELRFLKASKKTEDEMNQSAFDISTRYSNVLKKYENHRPIDFDLFKTTKNEYFNLTKWQIFIINLRFFIGSKLLYVCLVIFPVIAIYFIVK